MRTRLATPNTLASWRSRRVRPHVQYNQTSRSSCRAGPAALFLKGIFEILANRHVGDPATTPDARHRYGNIFGAMSPIQATTPDQGFLLPADTTHSPTT